MAGELEIFWQLRRIDGSFRRTFHAMAEQAGEKPLPEHGRGHGKILRVLDHGGGMTQKELAERLGIRPQSLTDALTRLEQQGAITRARSTRDKREQLVCITEQGRARSEKVARLHEQTAEAVLRGLSEEEKQQLCALLGRIVALNEEEEG